MIGKSAIIKAIKTSSSLRLKCHQKLGLGESMLRDALLRSLQASEIAGLKAIIAHANNQSAANFYK